jgi:membrane associated rhomboid family serine protease
MPQFSMPPLLPVTKRLLILNAVIWFASFLLIRLSGAPTMVPDAIGGGYSVEYGFGYAIYRFFALDPVRWMDWAPLVPVWQLVTYGFLHAWDDPMHLLMNSLWLYFFGTMVEGAVGSRRMFITYLAAMVLGGFVQLVGNVFGGQTALTVGASGAILCLLTAAATLQPDARVLVFIVFLRLKVLALIVVGLDVFWLLSGGGGATAYLVHITGAAFGFLAVKRGWIWKDPIQVVEQKRQAHAAVKAVDEERQLDELLARIHREGIGSLSNSERAFLKRVSKGR